jgi:heterodisulfide reductase subunit B
MQEILGSAVAGKADCLVTACTMYQLNLEIRNTHKARIPIFHFSEILALALGADDYEEWFVRTGGSATVDLENDQGGLRICSE